MSRYKVKNFDTGETLDGEPSAELISESAVAGDTGAVPSFRDFSGVWQYVAPSQVSLHRGLGRSVVTVWTEE